MQYKGPETLLGVINFIKFQVLYIDKNGRLNKCSSSLHRVSFLKEVGGAWLRKGEKEGSLRLQRRTTPISARLAKVHAGKWLLELTECTLRWWKQQLRSDSPLGTLKCVLFMWEISDRPTLWDNLQNTCPAIFKNTKTRKTRKVWPQGP